MSKVSLSTELSRRWFILQSCQDKDWSHFCAGSLEQNVYFSEFQKRSFGEKVSVEFRLDFKSFQFLRIKYAVKTAV